MEFKNIYTTTLPFIVQHTTGFGDQGGEPIRYKEYVGAHDTLEEAEEFIKLRYPRHPSGWTYDNGHIIINTLTEVGKKLYKEFEEKWEARMAIVEEDMKLHPENYRTYTSNSGMSITVKHNPIFDGDEKFEPFSLESSKITFIDPSK